jgi:hypothetical protein
MRCANCNETLHPSDTTGVSGLYNRGDGRKYLLCEVCWLCEEETVDRVGTNDIPSLRAVYEINQPGGWR